MESFQSKRRQIIACVPDCEANPLIYTHKNAAYEGAWFGWRTRPIIVSMLSKYNLSRVSFPANKWRTSFLEERTDDYRLLKNMKATRGDINLKIRSQNVVCYELILSDSNMQVHDLFILFPVGIWDQADVRTNRRLKRWLFIHICSWMLCSTLVRCNTCTMFNTCKM